MADSFLFFGSDSSLFFGSIAEQSSPNRFKPSPQEIVNMRTPKIKSVLGGDDLKILRILIHEPMTTRETYAALRSRDETLSEDTVGRHLANMRAKDMGFVDKLATGKWEITQKGTEAVMAIDAVVSQVESQNISVTGKEFESGIYHVPDLVSLNPTMGTLFAATLRKNTGPPTGSIP